MVVKRYIANGAFSLGPGKNFSRHHMQPDGTPGYLWEEIQHLDKGQRANFKEWMISGPGLVEEATANPGEVRAVPERACDECDFVAKSNAGLAVHRRSHSE